MFEGAWSAEKSTLVLTPMPVGRNRNQLVGNPISEPWYDSNFRSARWEASAAVRGCFNETTWTGARAETRVLEGPRCVDFCDEHADGSFKFHQEIPFSAEAKRSCCILSDWRARRFEHPALWNMHRCLHAITVTLDVLN